MEVLKKFKINDPKQFIEEIEQEKYQLQELVNYKKEIEEKYNRYYLMESQYRIDYEVKFNKWSRNYWNVYI